MKFKLRYIFTSLAIAGTVFSPVAVMAHEALAETSSGSGSTTSNTSDDNTTEVENESKDMAERIAKFKTSFKVKLNLAESSRIKLRCGGAQKVVGNLHTRFGNSVTVRTQAYTELQKNLDKLVTKLKAKNADTTTLEAQITELKTKINTYSTDLEAYKQALSDLKSVDCKADPAGFQAALLAARSAHDKLVTDVTGIRTYLTGTIKPTLQSIKKQLETSKSEDNSSSQGSSNSTSNGGQ